MNLGEGLIAGLSGLGKGAAVYPGALQAGSQQALGEAQLAEAMQHRQFQENQSNTNIGALYDTLGIPRPAGMTSATKIPTAWGPAAIGALEKNQLKQADLQKNDLLTKALMDQGAPEQLGPPNQGQTMPRVVTDPQLVTLSTLVPGLGHEKMAPLVAEYMKEQAPKITTHIVAGAEGPSVVTLDKQGNPVGPPRSLGIAPPESKGVWTPANINRRLDLEHATPGSEFYGRLPEGSLARQRAYDALARQVQVGPGGAAYGGEALLNPATIFGQAPTTQPPANQPKPTIQRAAMPNPGEREEIANLDAAQTQLQAVIDNLKKPGALGGVMGGVLKNPTGAAARTTEQYLGYGMTDEQRRMMGILGIQLQNVKHALIGATRTRPELADIAAAIPDEKGLLTGDTAQQAIQKLEALMSDLRNKRAARENVMGSTGVAVPARPGEAPTPAPSGWGKARVIR